jgi:perosamine synthetase
MIPVAQPALLGNEYKYVLDCLDRNELSGGKYVQQFEKSFAEFCDTKYAVSCCNGTSALHLALLALGLRAGQEVIVPAVTFVATANAVRYCGAIPVFADIDPNTWCIDPESVKSLISPKTVGIIPVHLYGVPADMDALLAIAGDKLWILEDAAEAHGAEYNKRPVGSLSQAAIFSFYGNKIITCGEGGMVTTSDDVLVERLKLIRGQGMDPERRYYHIRTGYNYRLGNLQAAIGCAQLEDFGYHFIPLKTITATYRQILAPRFTVQQTTANSSSANWMFTFLADHVYQRDRIARELAKSGIETRPMFIPLTEMPMYKQKTPSVARDIAHRGLSLPTYATLDLKTVNNICDLTLEFARETAISHV